MVLTEDCKVHCYVHRHATNEACG